MTSCNHVIREACDFVLDFSSPYGSTLSSYVFWKEKYFVFSLSPVLSELVVRGTCNFYGCVHLTISHQLAMFCRHRNCQKGYSSLLICHMNTHEHVVRGSCNSIIPLTISHQPVMFIGRRSCKRGDIKFSICAVTALDQLIKGTSDIIG